MTQTKPSSETAAAMPSTSQLNGRELTITRMFDAPRDLVFRAWTDPKQFAQWWGPRMFTNPICELDARPGGAILVHMRGPDGIVYPMKGLFHEVIEPERLVFTSIAGEDEQGIPWFETLTTVTFEDQGGKTKMTLQAVIVRSVPEARGALNGMEAGWNQSLDKLAEQLAGA